MTERRYQTLAIAIFNGDIDQFDHTREVVELRDSSRWKVNMKYDCFYMIRDPQGAAPKSLVTRSLP